MRVPAGIGEGQRNHQGGRTNKVDCRHITMRLREMTGTEPRVKRLKASAKAAKDRAKLLKVQADANAERLKLQKSRQKLGQLQRTAVTASIKPHT
jgi:hypothetical protein